MATDKKISELPVATGIQASDISVLVNGGTDYQYTFSLLLQFMAAHLAVGAKISFGTTLPQATDGSNGDVFVNTAAGSFAQKIAGTWTIVYTLPAANAADGTLLYGTGVPGAGTGKNTDSYINTLTGIFYKKAGGTWSQVFSMATGPQGPQGSSGTNGTNGSNGNTVLHGIINPSNTADGVNGDFYINTSNYTFFGPKAAGVWPGGISLIPGYVIGTIPFTAGGANPLVISAWQTGYFPVYSNGKFLVQFKDEDGNLQDRPDISIKRIVDRTGLPVQTAISMDQPGYPDGQIIIEYSNFNLI
jgi:hypothetical protein